MAAATATEAPTMADPLSMRQVAGDGASTFI